MFREGYLTVPNTTPLTTGYEQGGFPSFAIFTPTSGSYSEPSKLEGSYNNEEIFTFKFVLTTEGPVTQDIEAIPCEEAVNLYVEDAFVQ